MSVAAAGSSHRVHVGDSARRKQIDAGRMLRRAATIIAGARRALSIWRNTLVVFVAVRLPWWSITLSRIAAI